MCASVRLRSGFVSFSSEDEARFDLFGAAGGCSAAGTRGWLRCANARADEQGNGAEDALAFEIRGSTARMVSHREAPSSNESTRANCPGRSNGVRWREVGQQVLTWARIRRFTGTVTLESARMTKTSRDSAIGDVVVRKRYTVVSLRHSSIYTLRSPYMLDSCKAHCGTLSL